MSTDEYEQTLRLLKIGELSDSSSQEADESEVTSPKIPFDGFFGDDFLALLYLSPIHHNSSLEHIVAQIGVLVNESAPPRKRASSAIKIAQFVEARCGKGGGPGTSRPSDWFGLAQQWGSILGVCAHARHLLACSRMHVEFDLDESPFPKITGEEGAEALHSASNLWAQGIRLACRYARDGFSGWTHEELHSGLSCVINYLTLFPQQRIQARAEKMIQTRRDALQWITPVWNRLIERISSSSRSPERTISRLKEQQGAVLLYLDDLKSLQSQDEDGQSSARVHRKPVLPKTGDVVLMRQKFSPSNDRSEAAILSQYEMLLEPMKLTPLPPPMGLLQIRQTLEAEFPWAVEAIDAIMVDLTARQRFGVLRLGMWPLLMVGSPGTGKTRLAQRLSDLLGTPNTVINMAGMRDTNTLKGVSRGWSGSRPSRMVEFIQQNKVANPLFVLDEVDKTGGAHANGGDPLHALLDLLEIGNAKRFQDVFLMAEVDLSHCLYIATTNSLESIPEPLLSRFRLVYVPSPAPEHTDIIAKSVLRDIERHWGLPEGVMTLSDQELERLTGLSPREMRQALISFLGRSDQPLTVH